MWWLSSSIALSIATTTTVAADRVLPDAVWRFVTIDCDNVEHETLEGKNCQDHCVPCSGTPEQVSKCLGDAGLLHCQYGFFGLITRHMDLCNVGDYSWILIERADHEALRLNETATISLWFFNRTEIPEKCAPPDSANDDERPKVATIALPSNYESEDSVHTRSCSVNPKYALPTAQWQNVSVEIAPQLASSVEVKLNRTLTKSLIVGLRAPFALALRSKFCGLDWVRLPGEGAAVEVGSWVPFPPRSWRGAAVRNYGTGTLFTFIILVTYLVH